MKKIILLFIAVVAFGSANWAQQIDPKATTEKFNTLLHYVEQMYVDTVDSEALVEVAIRKMLEELDPHSVYISKEDLAAANEPLNGSFDGIGVQFNILKDTIYVVSPISGGPSEKLGIMAGDKIIEVDGENVAGIGITNRDVMDKLKGPKGTKVTVGIKRGKSKKLIAFEITRDKIPIYSVDASYMVNPKLGYIKVNRFARTTTEELRTAMAELKEEGMTELILDLQGNGGGLLNAAIEMADEFLSEDKLIVYTEGRSFPRRDTHANKTGEFEKGKLVVLIDEGSASASEIVSGAIQDWDRGMIVGRRSFGKGLVQRPIPLPDGSAVRLTVQKYFTPSGRCIQKPYDDGTEAYRMEKYDRYASGEMWSLDSLELPDSLKYETNIKKRTVYGGGGILPDIFVPIDTTYASEYFTGILRKGLTSKYALNYLDRNRAALDVEYPTIESFISSFQVSEEMMQELIALAEKEELPFDEEGYSISEFAIQTRVKALIGRNIYGSDAFYEIINVLNESFVKAVKCLDDGTFDRMKLAHRTF